MHLRIAEDCDDAGGEISGVAVTIGVAEVAGKNQLIGAADSIRGDDWYAAGQRLVDGDLPGTASGIHEEITGGVGAGQRGVLLVAKAG